MARTTKIALAREQLEDGIGLFLSGRYVSALTLLGASEEILSRIIQEQTGTHPLENLWQWANRTRTRLGHPHLSKQEIFKSWNAGRNTVKHHNPGEPQNLNHDRFGEAFMMIQRATSCADHLKLKYVGKKLYKAWLVEKGFP
ncbi:hypothetical protein [Stutzerimonas stutzeri]|uniref:hypothetical protein n=1 Tax=Stutzerimonas stutzeri TaxID=316 RepID=UPI0011861259|nr:hypothetical protein [Stutzerimonas stutzeri]